MEAPTTPPRFIPTEPRSVEDTGLILAFIADLVETVAGVKPVGGNLPLAVTYTPATIGPVSGCINFTSNAPAATPPSTCAMM